MKIVDGNARVMQLAVALLNAEQPICSIGEISSFAQECNISMSESCAYLIAASTGIDTESDPEDRDFFEHWLKPSIHLSHVSSYINDPYYKEIHFRGQTQGNWCYGQELIKPGELFVEGDMIRTFDNRVLPQLGFFMEEYLFPAVFEGGSDWMSLAPNETVTLKQPIADAKGRVLTYGLGLGYFAYMAARKDEVTSVTIVEREQNAIDLFAKNVLPLCKNREKIMIIKDDAIRFSEKLQRGKYDYVFADIWRDAGDGIDIYLKLKQFEKNDPNAHFAYWIEKSMDIYLDRSLWP